jgi:ribosomal protein S18 acetylase RimI-like enzyme
MFIHILTEITDEVVEAFKHLMPQLTDFSAPPDRHALARMASSKHSYIFLARAESPSGRIIGTAALGIFETPTGVHGWIEDVVVDRSARRQGVGRALTKACLDKARELGLREVNLTSRPSRQAANQLYQDMGFEQRETNVYRYPLN